MKIHEYNEMMAYLMRPAQEAKLVDDLEPGSLKEHFVCTSWYALPKLKVLIKIFFDSIFSSPLVI